MSSVRYGSPFFMALRFSWFSARHGSPSSMVLRPPWSSVLHGPSSASILGPPSLFGSVLLNPSMVCRHPLARFLVLCRTAVPLVLVSIIHLYDPPSLIGFVLGLDRPSVPLAPFYIFRSTFSLFLFPFLLTSESVCYSVP